MCGIAGFIGNSNNPELSFNIITKLFEKIESRGKDASGFWCVSQDDSITHHKEPVSSTEFVKSKNWINLKNKNPKLILCHAREASKGIGPPSDNKNNHPFVSNCSSIGVVHNGRIPDSIYDYLKIKYETISNCDSELFLRMFESSKPDERLDSIKEMWTKLEGSHMAVAIGEYANDAELWLFRNEHRSLWEIYLTELNQLFFFSTKEIWMDALSYFDDQLNINILTHSIELDIKKIYYLKIENNSVIQKII